MSQRNWHFSSKWLQVLIFVLLALGIFFRFVNLEQKVYWPDEVFTSLRISGYTVKEVIQQTYTGHLINIEYLQKYQHLNSQKGLIDTIHGLAIEEPQHTPFYYAMVRFWVQLFGDSIAVTRSFSAWISLLAFPCVYWLCLELFGSSLTANMALALLAISPFHVLYAQEARPFSLWIVTTLLSSAALLRAMRLKNTFSWVIYGATLSLSLYTFLLSGLVAIGHGIYVFAMERFRFTKIFISFLFTSLIGFLFFLPWVLVVITNLSEATSTTDWAGIRVSIFTLVTMWAGNISRVFFDVGFGADNSFSELLLLVPPILLLLLLLAYAIYFICSQTQKRIWLFHLTFIGTTAIALILPDLILGGRRSGVARYLIPCYLGIQLAVAHLLATHIAKVYVNTWQRKLWQVVIIVLITSGIFSCVLGSQARVWWNKDPERTGYIFKIADVVNQAKQPLLISDSKPDLVLSLSHLLEPKVQFLLLAEPDIPTIVDGFRDVFVYKPSMALRSKIGQKRYKIKPVYQDPGFGLWKLAKL